MISNPEYLPKDRLKIELKKHGISFNPNENKDYYVQLYRTQVMTDSEAGKFKSEFSSDEEFVRNSPRPAKKQSKLVKNKKSGGGKMEARLTEVQTLTDEQLIQQLEEYGESTGPITSTTRSVYERKLAKLLATGPHHQAATEEEEVEKVGGAEENTSFIKEWSSEEESDTEEIDAGSAPPPRTGKDKQQSEVRKRKKEVSSSKSGTTSSQSKKSKPPSNTSNILSLLCSVVLLTLMFMVAFLVYEHYTCAEDKNSLISQGWVKASETVVMLREMMINETPQPQPTDKPNDVKSKVKKAPKDTKKANNNKD